MTKLMIGSENIVKWFCEMHEEESNILSMYVSTDMVGCQKDHEDYCWEELVGFAISQVITSPFAFEYDTIDNDKITMARIVYEQMEGEKFWVEDLITPNGIEKIKLHN